MSRVEVIFLGRGGQGVVTSAYVLAKAAFHDGKEVQAFPFFGVERRGAPVMSFCRISNKPIKTREQIYRADYMIILDPMLVKNANIENKIKEDGIVLVNSSTCPVELKKVRKKLHAIHVDATSVALEVIGKPFVNIPMLGAFASISDIIRLSSLKKAIDEMFVSKHEMAELNKRASEKLYKMMKDTKILQKV